MWIYPFSYDTAFIKNVVQRQNCIMSKSMKQNNELKVQSLANRPGMLWSFVDYDESLNLSSVLFLSEHRMRPFLPVDLQ